MATARRGLAGAGTQTAGLAFGGNTGNSCYSSHRRMVRSTNYSNRFNLDYLIIKYI
jgi:hypothetical protein